MLQKVDAQTAQMGNHIQTIQSEHESFLQARSIDDDNWQKTKIRQFNSMHKYLNPTMIALLRMEMFGGGATYEYRADEKQLSKELFTFNPTMYSYMKNEWRFPLPEKHIVESWCRDDNDDEQIM